MIATSRPTSPLLQHDGFVWGTGIEDTIIGRPLRDGGRDLDEYALTQHDRWWRDDLDRAASLGVQAIRYGIPWPKVNPAPDRFDWHHIDEVLAYAVQEKGLLVIADLVHYGTPAWLPAAFVDRDYPRAVAAYSAAFARRYSPLVHHYTPLNEPLITASFCGQRAVWPPYLDGDQGWLHVVLGVVAGIRQACLAIRAADPDAVIVHVEAAKVLRRSSLASEAMVLERERAFLPTDLLLGRVHDEHPLIPWLRALGVSAQDIRSFPQAPVDVDVIGVNYYPDLSVRELVKHDGATIEVAVEGWDSGLIETMGEFWRRYQLPLVLSETSLEGDEQRQLAWLDASAAAIAQLRAAGCLVRGYTWWPLLDFVDWSYASGGRTVEEFWTRTVAPDGSTLLSPVLPPADGESDIASYLRRMGLWRLSPRSDDILARTETAAARRFRGLTARGLPTP